MPKQSSSSKAKKKEGKAVNKKKHVEILHNEIAKVQNDFFDFGGLPAQDLKKNLGCS